MKITFLLPELNLSGGIRVIAIYAEKLRQRGHDVRVVAPPPRRLGLRDRYRELMRGRVWRMQPEPAMDATHFNGTEVEIHILDQCRPIVDSDLPDADVVIATWWKTAEWLAKLSPRKGAKAYFIQHHEVHPWLPVDRVEATWRLPVHKIVISNWLADLSRDKYGDVDYSLIPNSVDQNQFWAEPRGKNSTPTVGLLYSTVPFKGCEISIRALELCAQRIAGLRVVAFGGTSPIAELPLPPGADFTLAPNQKLLRFLYSKCDVWLCGSWSEGFHLPPSEAMACRCPVVSTRVGGPMDLIRDGVNGHLVDVGDVEGLADRLVKVLNLTDLSWRKLSDAAFEAVCHYTWDDATDRFEAALNRLLEKPQTLSRTK